MKKTLKKVLLFVWLVSLIGYIAFIIFSAIKTNGFTYDPNGFKIESGATWLAWIACSGLLGLLLVIPVAFSKQRA